MFVCVFYPDDQEAVASLLEEEIVPLSLRGSKRLGCKVHPSKREEILGVAPHSNFFSLEVEDVFDSTQIPASLRSAQYGIDYSKPAPKKKSKGRPKKDKK
tara:strand:+ start:250 stop:549 length:300 start_codon:yes stop_codon:yes gene_type:complete